MRKRKTRDDFVMQKNGFFFKEKRKKSSGFVMAYVISAIAVFATLAAGAVSISRQNIAQHSNTSCSKTIVSQASYISSVIVACATRFAEADNGCTNACIKNLPLANTNTSISSLVCPGNSTNIWTQSYLPQPFPNLFPNGWQFVNATGKSALALSSTTETGKACLASAAKTIGSQAEYVSGTGTMSFSIVK